MVFGPAADGAHPRDRLRKEAESGSRLRKRRRVLERSLLQRCGERAGGLRCPNSRRRTSKGNKAQGRTGRFATGNGRGSKPDLTAEQSLEAEEPADRLSKPGTGNGNWRKEREGRGQRQGATATAMWCGCGAGDSSKGVKQRREECLTSRNTTNLTTGSGMQQARNLRAEETIGVVQNHEDGTRLLERDLREPKHAAMHAGVDARQGRYRGMQTEGEGRKVRETGPETTGNTLWRRAKTRGSARFEASQGAPERRDAVGRPRRRARQRVTSRRERESPTTRYDGSTSHERDFNVPPRATP